MKLRNYVCDEIKDQRNDTIFHGNTDGCLWGDSYIPVLLHEGRCDEWRVVVCGTVAEFCRRCVWDKHILQGETR